MKREPETDIWTNETPFALVEEQDLSTRWKKSRRTLQRWRAEGYGPPYIRVGGTIHYLVSDVLDFERRQRVGGEESQ